MSSSSPRRRTPPNKPTPESSPLLPDTPFAASSPLLPTRHETLALLIVPLILLIGSIYSFVDPSIRSAPYDHSIHAIHQHESHLPSYFASKNNVFNIYFVKLGWAWLGLAIGVWTLRVHSLATKSNLQASRLASQVVLRYVALTVLWILVVRWIPIAGDGGLIDVVFRWSGGVCSRILQEDAEKGFGETHMVNRAPGSPVDGDSPSTEQGLEDLSLKVSAAACRAAGGSWGGGHDISGHVFLMGCAMAMLALEVLPWVVGGSRAVTEDDGEVKVRAVGSKAVADPYAWEFVFVGGVYGLFAWMILMTAVFFHTWPEKTTGFILSFTSVYLVYFVPRAVSTLRNFLGVPGL